MKKMLLILSFTMLTKVFAGEVTWETLKTLEVDPKTKNPVAKGELQKALGTEITMKGFMMPLTA